MKKALKLTLAVALMMGATSLYAQKFGRINSQEIVMAMPETKEMQTNLETFGKELNENIETINVEFNNKLQEYQKTANTLTDAVREMKAKELEDLQRRSQEFQQMAQRDYAKKQEELLQPIIEKAKAAIDKIAAAGGYLFVFDTSAGSLAYFDEAALTDLAPEVRKELGITELGGAYVAGVVEGGSASEAGIRKGDVILDIDGVKINDNATLSEQIGRRRPNDKVKLSVKRDGAVKQFEVTLRNKAGKTELMTKEDVDVVEVLGGKFADAGTKLCRELDIRGGVQVVGIKADGILARARVKQGFVITHINDRPVYSLGDMQRMTEKVRSIDGVYPNGRSASYTLVE